MVFWGRNNSPLISEEESQRCSEMHLTRGGLSLILSMFGFMSVFILCIYLYGDGYVMGERISRWTLVGMIKGIVRINGVFRDLSMR